MKIWIFLLKFLCRNEALGACRSIRSETNFNVLLDLLKEFLEFYRFHRNDYNERWWTKTWQFCCFSLKLQISTKPFKCFEKFKLFVEVCSRFWFQMSEFNDFEWVRKPYKVTWKWCLLQFVFILTTFETFKTHKTLQIHLSQFFFKAFSQNPLFYLLPWTCLKLVVYTAPKLSVRRWGKSDYFNPINLFSIFMGRQHKQFEKSWLGVFFIFVLFPPLRAEITEWIFQQKVWVKR